MKWQPTVQGWQNLVLAVMGVVVLAGAIAGTFLLNRTDDVSNEITGEIAPMRIAAYQLQAALRDQETSVRGYAISADPQFLQPYVAGQKAEAAAAQVIREHAGVRTKVLADVDAIEHAAASWRTSYAEPLIADVKPGVPAVIEAHDSRTTARPYSILCGSSSTPSSNTFSKSATSRTTSSRRCRTGAMLF